MAALLENGVLLLIELKKNWFWKGDFYSVSVLVKQDWAVQFS